MPINRVARLAKVMKKFIVLKVVKLYLILQVQGCEVHPPIVALQTRELF
jgi:hypothetical protein